jgi:hypothetical protein
MTRKVEAETRKAEAETASIHFARRRGQILLALLLAGVLCRAAGCG